LVDDDDDADDDDDDDDDELVAWLMDAVMIVDRQLTRKPWSTSTSVQLRSTQSPVWSVFISTTTDQSQLIGTVPCIIIIRLSAVIQLTVQRPTYSCPLT